MHKYQEQLVKRLIEAQERGERLTMSYPRQHGMSVMKKRMDEWIKIHASKQESQ